MCFLKHYITEEAKMAVESVNGWTISTLLGEGGFGKVYLATKDGMNAAIKVGKVPKKTKKQKKTKAIDLIHYEFLQISKLHHQGIVKMALGEYITHELNGDRCLVLEYLHPWNKQNNIDKIANDLENALHYIHRHGYVHGDIKPDNIMFTESGETKIIDFGTCLPFKSYKGDIVEGKGRNGTPDYMSIPVTQGAKPLPPDDFQSLIFTLFEMDNEMLPWSQKDDTWMTLQKKKNAKLQDINKHIIPALVYLGDDFMNENGNDFTGDMDEEQIYKLLVFCKNKFLEELELEKSSFFRFATLQYDEKMRVIVVSDSDTELDNPEDSKRRKEKSKNKSKDNEDDVEDDEEDDEEDNEEEPEPEVFQEEEKSNANKEKANAKRTKEKATTKTVKEKVTTKTVIMYCCGELTKKGTKCKIKVKAEGDKCRFHS